MHDFILAKEIIDELKRISQDKNLEKIKKVRIEIGQIAMAHDGYPEHTEDISIDNLIFGLKSIGEKAGFSGVEFDVQKTEGDNWKIMDIEV